MARVGSWRKAWTILIVFTGLFFIGLSAVLAVNYPYRKSPYVNDYANVLTPQTVTALNTMLTEMQSRDNVEMSVITINSITDYPLSGTIIEEFSQNLFNRWGLGNALTDKGVLMVVAIKDRKVRIQLGDGYSASYSDKAKGIITDYILPAFKVEDYNTGILRGVKGAINMATGHWATGGQLTLVDSPSFPLIVGGLGLLGLGILGFGLYSYSSHKCPSCGKSTLQISSTITQAPTISHGGEKAILRDCPHCGFHDERTIMLGALTPYYGSARSDRYHSHWSSGSSGGRSSGGGGGHSSGGGATGSW